MQMNNQPYHKKTTSMAFQLPKSKSISCFPALIAYEWVELEANLGLLSSNSNVAPEVVAAAETELEAIEKEEAYLAEEDAKGVPFGQETIGLIAQINALKGVMQEME